MPIPSNDTELPCPVEPGDAPSIALCPICEMVVLADNPCNCCSNCDNTDEGCTCCEICDGSDSTECGCCQECEHTSGNCSCCSICDGDRDDCDCCRNCEHTSENCTCCSVCHTAGGDCGCCTSCESPEGCCSCCECCESTDRDNCGCRYCEGCDCTTLSHDWRRCCDRCKDCCECRTCQQCDERQTSDCFADDLSVCEDCSTNNEEDGGTVPEVELIDGEEPLVRCAHKGEMVPSSRICPTHRTTHSGRTYCFDCCGHPECGHPEGIRNKCGTCKRCSDCCTCVCCPGCDSRTTMCEVCARCHSCCSCIRCGRYNSRSSSRPSHIAESVCGGCANCLEHCTCPRCAKCNVKASRHCTVCSQCSTCCSWEGCGAMLRYGEVIQFKERPLAFYTPFGIAHRRRNPTVREVSVEIETNVRANRTKGLKLHTALEKWGDSVVSDGSIGDGHEINTNPSGGDFFYDHIRELCDGFEDMGVTANEKCGMHVHVNAKDTGLYDLRRVVMLYERIERALFDVCHPRRLNYSYSLKCGDFFSANVKGVDPKGFKQEIYAQLYNGGKKLGLVTAQPVDSYHAYWNHRQCVGKRCKRVGSGDTDSNSLCRDCYVSSISVKHLALQAQGVRIKTAVSRKSHGLRYKALNLHSYFHRGSIEFRHHEGSTDYTTITSFGRICAEIINAGNRLSETEIKALPANSRRAMLAVIPTDLHPFIFAEWTKNDAIRKGDGKYKAAYQAAWGL